MKRIALTLIIIVSGLESFSQNANVSDTIPSSKKYVVWFSPSKATHVYGLMFNFWPRNEGCSYEYYPTIYGGEINLNPIGLIVPFLVAIYSIDPKTHAPLDDNIDSINFDLLKKINGFQLAGTDYEPSVINGLDINASGSFETKTNGVTISALMNKHYIINGLTIGAIGNHDLKCNGVQIGLINSCRELKGFQFGLWNKNQKRSLPIINWCFNNK